MYLLGSVAFPGFSPHRADIDFLVVVRREPDAPIRAGLDGLHRSLARRFAHGARLDGFYLSQARARRHDRPEGIVGAGNGRTWPDAADRAWALHREHVHRGAVLVLHGQNPRRVVPRPSRREIDEELRAELDTTLRAGRTDPTYAVLNLCRLLMTRAVGDVALSKKQAAAWALRALPAWRGVVVAARRDYDGRATASDQRTLRRDGPRFVRSAARDFRQTSGRIFRRA